ncbi:T9SS type A sorting domain-containing protein, partial [bacterium]|nr:T9SS type A sorting domain-containing protein [bacterium]
ISPGWISYGDTISGSDTGQFNGAGGVAIDSLGRIYIADFWNSRIVRIDDMTGAGWTELGSFGTGEFEFWYVQDVAIGPDGKIYIVDGNNRIVRMDDMTGAGWTTFGEYGFGEGEFAYPLYIWVTSPPTDKITEKRNLPNKMDISVYPNPFNSSCRITIDNVGAYGIRPLKTTVAIYNLRGNAVYTRNVGAKNFSPLPNGIRTFIWTPDKSIPSGVYLVMAKTADGQKIAKRIVYIK